MDKLYVVTYDKYTKGCGAELFLIGVYDDADAAIMATKEPYEKGYRCKIIPVEKNETCKTNSAHFIGGYRDNN